MSTPFTGSFSLGLLKRVLVQRSLISPELGFWASRLCLTVGISDLHVLNALAEEVGQGYGFFADGPLFG